MSGYAFVASVTETSYCVGPILLQLLQENNKQFYELDLPNGCLLEIFAK